MGERGINSTNIIHRFKGASLTVFESTLQSSICIASLDEWCPEHGKKVWVYKKVITRRENSQDIARTERREDR